MSLTIRSDTNTREISYHKNGLDIPTKYFFAPINTGFSSNGSPTSELIEFHKKRSGKGIGISYVGNIAIAPEYVTNSNTAYFTSEKNYWEDLTKAIENEGSLPGAQIACRNSTITPIRKMLNNDIEGYIKTVQSDLNQISTEEIQNIINLFIDSAVHSFEVGFKVIQIHAAHGYFLSQMLNENLNKRSDRYGKRRYIIISEIVEGIRKLLKHEIILDLRISLIDGLFTEEVELKSKFELIKELTLLDLDMISFSNGIYDINKQLIYPIKEWGHGTFIEKSIYFAQQYPDFVWNTCGNIWDLEELNRADLPSNLTFSLGRSLIADPYFVQKSLEGSKEKINHCIRKHKCHYYSLNKKNVTCPVYEKSQI